MIRRIVIANVVVLAMGFLAVVVPMTAWGQTGVLFVQDNKVGIGIDTPAWPLHVVKSPVGGNAILAEGGAFGVLRSDNGFANIRFQVTNAPALPGSAQAYLFSLNPTNGAFLIRNETDGRDAVTVRKDALSQNLVVTNGRIGIMTSAPAGALDVNGAIYQRGGLLHADYVFQPGYELESIDEHAAFMWGNRHLPAIPKAMTDEAGREVIEVGAHQRGILEELEKAHIYIEQLNDQLQESRSEIQGLQAQIDELKTLVSRSN